MYAFVVITLIAIALVAGAVRKQKRGFIHDRLVLENEMLIEAARQRRRLREMENSFRVCRWERNELRAQLDEAITRIPRVLMDGDQYLLFDPEESSKRVDQRPTLSSISPSISPVTKFLPVLDSVIAYVTCPECGQKGFHLMGTQASGTVVRECLFCQHEWREKLTD